MPSCSRQLFHSDDYSLNHLSCSWQYFHGDWLMVNKIWSLAFCHAVWWTKGASDSGTNLGGCIYTSRTANSSESNFLQIVSVEAYRIDVYCNNGNLVFLGFGKTEKTVGWSWCCSWSTEEASCRASSCCWRSCNWWMGM